jgi:hypothetical protein
MCPQMLPTSVGHRDEPPKSDFVTTDHKPAVIGVFPYGQTRTRGPPGIEYLNVRPRAWANPVEKVEDQRLNGVGH